MFRLAVKLLMWIVPGWWLAREGRGIGIACTVSWKKNKTNFCKTVNIKAPGTKEELGYWVLLLGDGFHSCSRNSVDAVILRIAEMSSG